MTRRTLAGGAFAAALMLWGGMASADQPFDPGMIPDGHLFRPDGITRAVVMLISDAGGWTAADDQRAAALRDQGAAVIGVDLPRYLATQVAQSDDCIYMVSDIEALAHQIERQAGTPSYAAPIIAGKGAGGALALDIAAQSPDATIGGVIAVDPPDGLAMKHTLCSGAPRRMAGDRTVYGLQPGTLPAPVTLHLTPDAPAEGRAHAAELVAGHSDVSVIDETGTADDVLTAALNDALSALSDSDQPLGLPLTILDAKPSYDTMAVVLSGDGGWRDIDMQIGQELQAKGVPVVGLDSLRYFWSERRPEEIAHDLARIIETYRTRWNVRHVLLAGYSFGADVLPRAYAMLPKADQDAVAMVSLLALSNEVDYQVSVEGWLGMSGSATTSPVDDIPHIPAGVAMCVYGEDEDDDPCPTLEGKGIEVVKLTGGHHFDGDYADLADRILAGLNSRLFGKGTAPAGNQGAGN